MKRLAVLLAAAALSALGCTSFPVIEAGVCGNRVVETDAGEACDTFAQKETQRCRPPGDELPCQYDCRVGSNGVRPECPNDRGCAPDGVCRVITEAYEAPLTLSVEPTDWLSTADFDGDGRIDLLSAEPHDQVLQGHFRVHYFNEGERDVTTRVFPRETTRPVVRDVDADGKSDFLFSTFRLALVPGRRDRDWLPATFSSYQVPTAGLRVLSVFDELVGGTSALAVLTDIKGVPGLYLPDGTALELRKGLPGFVRELTGTPIVADIFRGPTSPCSEIVLAFEGADSFRVYDLCFLDTDPNEPEVQWRSEPLEQVVHLPTGLGIQATPIAADVNGDGLLDVIVGAAGQLYVAYGDGERLGDEAEPLEVAITNEQGEAVGPLPVPLAAGDLSGDGFADFILSDSIISSHSRLSGDGRTYSRSYENRGTPWTMAEVADLNGNGLPDVIAAAAGLPGLDFVNGTGTRYQVGTAVPTDGPVQFLTTGDFDGDLINDVAFAQGSHARDGANFLVLAFGARDTPPLPGKRIAELRDVEQLGSLGEHGLDNLFVASKQKSPADPISTLTLFEGSPDRLPFAPYSLVTFAVDGKLEDSQGLAVVAGSFTAPRANDVVAFATKDLTKSWTQWLVPNVASGRYPPRLLDGAPPSEIIRPLSGEGADLVVSLAGAAADLDGDGRDEVLWLLPEGDDGCALLVYDIDAEAGAAVQKDIMHFGEPCRTPELVAFDQDGDKHVDLMLLLGSPQRLHVLWNDALGGFSLERRTILSDPERGEIRGFSPFLGTLGDAYHYRIALLSAHELYVASPTLYEDTADSEQFRTFDSIAPVSDLEDARAVVVLDPNGDEVPGIAVADAQGIRLFEAALK